MAAPCRFLCRKVFKVSNVFKSPILLQYPQNKVNTIVVRHKGLTSKSTRPRLRDLWDRRRAQGPEAERPRNVYPNWNYDAEIYAFGKRLGEEFDGITLRTAFIHSSYIEREIEKRRELGIESEDTLSMEDNSTLVTEGGEIVNGYTKAYLRHCYPALPEECISALHSYLTTEEMLSHIALHLGVKDLILCKEFPPSEKTLMKTFHAVVGALSADQGVERAHLFVQDFVLTQLAEKDLSNILSTAVHDPMGVLGDILEKEGRGSPEPRLLFEAASATILAAYQVGIYSDKQLVGRSFGETATIAEEMAARDALQRVWSVTLNSDPLPYGDRGRNIEIDFSRVNQTIEGYKPKQLEQSS